MAGTQLWFGYSLPARARQESRIMFNFHGVQAAEKCQGG